MINAKPAGGSAQRTEAFTAALYVMPQQAKPTGPQLRGSCRSICSVASSLRERCRFLRFAGFGPACCKDGALPGMTSRNATAVLLVRGGGQRDSRCCHAEERNEQIRVYLVLLLST